MRWLSKTRYKIGFLVPTLLVYVVFIILPIFIAIGYSFTRYSGIGKARFIGLDNYKRLFHDQLFWKSLQNTAIISPAIIAPIIVGIIWVYILDPKIGVINNILRSIGAGSLAKQWIGGTVLSPYSMAIIYFWQQLGYLTTIFIAGLKMIPEEVLEAVKVDGANAVQRVFYVIIPMMRSSISTVIVLIITGIFKIFEIVQQTTGGGPNHMSETLVTYSYSMTFQSSEYGYGMSIATVTFLISLGITGIYFLFSKERG